MMIAINPWLRLYILTAVASSILLLASLSAPMAGDDTTAGSDTKSDSRIHITADRLVTDTQSQYAKFSGNVKVVRGDTVILSDVLRIYYQKSAGNDQQINPGADSIRSIVAEGNVKINFDQQVATTQQAEWVPKDQTIVLTGPGSTIVSGNNSISGSKITVHQLDNRIKVEGGADEQVQAVFYSEENGMTLPGNKP